MAIPKSPDAFPAAFTMILERFRDPSAQAVVTHYDRAADAAKVRFTFYSFKKSLHKAGRVDDLRVANGILVRLIDDLPPSGGASLEFSLRDNLAWALDLEAALMQVGGGPASSVEGHTLSIPSPSPTPQASSDALVDQYLAGSKG